MRIHAILLFLLIGTCLQVQGQDDSYVRKHSFYMTWGYNRAQYQPSDIRFKGDDFDFTLYDVEAHDAPTPYETRTYLNPVRLTIPQFDFRIGYFLNDKTSISGGWDHMKYKVTQYQRVKLDGTISETLSDTYAGVYDNARFDLRPDFIQLEHTNGFNFLRFGIERHAVLWANKKGTFHADAMLGLSLGASLPWTDSHVDNVRYKNWVHLAGWGTSGQLAVKFRYKNTFFLQYQHQTGVVYMSDIIFMDESPNRASQKVVFNEQSISIGAQIPIFIGGNPNFKKTDK